MNKKRLLPALVAAGLLCWDGGAVAAEQSFDCMVRQLRVNAERFFVRCHSRYAGLEIPAYVTEIQYYSVPYSQENARYLFDLVLEARGGGKALRLIFEDDPASNPAGCSADNCRRIVALGMRY
ncbi:MAG: hypothetical protein AAGE85_01480 [Pseudomonadota bacterium]